MLCTARGQETADDPVALFNQGQELHEKGDLDGAVKLYDEAIKVLPEFPEAEYQRASALQTLGKLDAAEKGFRRAVELRPDWSLALTGLGSLLVREEKLSEAETVLAKALEVDPQNSSALASIAGLRIRSNASPAVLQDILTKIAAATSKANPTAALWMTRAGLEKALGKPDLAKISLAKSLAIEPNNPTALLQLAYIALAAGDLERAKNIATEIEKTGQSKDDLAFLKASIFAQEGNSGEALKQLDTIARPTKEATELRSRLTAAVATNAVDIEKQLASDPKNAALLGRLCVLYRKDDPTKALDYCRRASEAEPNNISHAVGYGAALVQAKQYDAAANLLRKLIEFSPDNWTAHANLATALFQLNRLAEARTEYQWLVAKQPRSAAPYYFLGVVHDKLGEYPDASATYQQYLKLADPVQNKLEIESVTFRLPLLQKLIKEGKKRTE